MRAKRAPIRRVKPESKYNSERIAKFINYVMVDGKKVVAQKIVYNSLDKLATATKKKPLEAFEEKLVAEMLDAINNTGGAVAHKETVHKAAEANRAFAHFRW